MGARVFRVLPKVQRWFFMCVPIVRNQLFEIGSSRNTDRAVRERVPHPGCASLGCFTASERSEHETCLVGPPPTVTVAAAGSSALRVRPPGPGARLRAPSRSSRSRLRARSRRPVCPSGQKCGGTRPGAWVLCGARRRVPAGLRSAPGPRASVRTRCFSPTLSPSDCAWALRRRRTQPYQTEAVPRSSAPCQRGESGASPALSKSRRAARRARSGF